MWATENDPRVTPLGKFLRTYRIDEIPQLWNVLLGDMTWETSYGLPGEGLPPRVQADITLEWPTWAQTAYRAWLGLSWIDRHLLDRPVPDRLFYNVSLSGRRP